MTKFLIAFGIVLAAGLAGCQALDDRGVSGETQGTVGGAVGNEMGERYDE